jgi:hypothetical protein
MGWILECCAFGPKESVGVEAAVADLLFGTLGNRLGRPLKCCPAWT